MTMYGQSWSTLKDELNRLANGGGTTYPPRQSYLDVSGAARAWAAARGVAITKTDAVGVINQIAGITDEKDFLDFSGVGIRFGGLLRQHIQGFLLFYTDAASLQLHGRHTRPAGPLAPQTLSAGIAS